MVFNHFDDVSHYEIAQIDIEYIIEIKINVSQINLYELNDL